MKRISKYLLAVFLLLHIWSCQGKEVRAPEPHLELGQRISFVGGQEEKTYVIIGYRHFLEDKTEKQWEEQAYIVFSYLNNAGDIKTAAIHKNAVLKR